MVSYIFPWYPQRCPHDIPITISSPSLSTSPEMDLDFPMPQVRRSQGLADVFICLMEVGFLIIEFPTFSGINHYESQSPGLWICEFPHLFVGIDSEKVPIPMFDA
jgi:hypothetical protein